MCARLLFQELTRGEISAIAPTALVVLPVGAVEQHGPHLPVGTDWFAVEHIARMAATEAAHEIPVVVAPTLPFGSSQHHVPFGGTLSLGTELYYRVLTALVESLIACGFRNGFILNGHGGNHELMQLVVRDLALKHAVHLAAASYWHLAADGLAASTVAIRGRIPGHAGAFETSLVLALRPEIVATPLPHREIDRAAPQAWIPSGVRAEQHGSWQQIDGYTDSPDEGNASYGNAALATIVHIVARTLVACHRAQSTAP